MAILITKTFQKSHWSLRSRRLGLEKLGVSHIYVSVLAPEITIMTFKRHWRGWVILMGVTRGSRYLGKQVRVFLGRCRSGSYVSLFTVLGATLIKEVAAH